MKTIALIVAGGSSVRFGGDVPKQYREAAGRPLLAWTISRFEAAARIDEIVLVVAEEYLLHAGEKVVDPYRFAKVTKVVAGGSDRQESVRKGLESLPISTGWVAIHDGARPLVRPEDIDRVVETAITDRAAMLAALCGRTGVPSFVQCCRPSFTYSRRRKCHTSVVVPTVDLRPPRDRRCSMATVGGMPYTASTSGRPAGCTMLRA